MIKIVVLIFSFFVAANSIHAQEKNIDDSLKTIINQGREDTNEVNSLNYVANEDKNFRSAVSYLERSLSIAKKLNYKKGEANSNLILSSLYGSNGYLSESIQHSLNALSDYNQLKDNTGIASSHLLLQGSYRDAEDFNYALLHEFEGEKISETNHVKGIFIFPNHNLSPLFLAEIGQTYILENKPDSALIYVQKSLQQNELFNGSSWEFPFYLLATVQEMKGDYFHSLQNYRTALSLAKIQTNNARDTLQIYSGISTLFKKTGQLDSSIYYADIVNQSWKPEISETKNLLEAVNNLYEVYKLKGKKDSSLKYLELMQQLRGNFYNTEKEKQIQEVTFNEQLKQQQLIAEQARYKNRAQAFMFTAGILSLLLISGLLIRNNMHSKKAKRKIEIAYNELRTTQAQLIQSEKMASLGELTAGIAHEIQNPLNFVNNFSEINAELLTEMKNELLAGSKDEAIAIANDIIENEQKIKHHGERADSIVKGMLQHSRKSSGQKELMNINALADEYLRLSYHGLRAKDKSFNARVETNFDSTVGKINIIPQDIGRVLLNLFNNAFYAVAEKKKQQTENYEPKVSVTTKKVNDEIEIKVIDNGSGIPKNIIDKVFQPFFTTKPTGEGTGLGLSLSYDIVKAHGGEIKVESKDGEGTEFTIDLPAS